MLYVFLLFAVLLLTMTEHLSSQMSLDDVLSTATSNIVNCTIPPHNEAQENVMKFLFQPHSDKATWK